MRRSSVLVLSLAAALATASLGLTPVAASPGHTTLVHVDLSRSGPVDYNTSVTVSGNVTYYDAGHRYAAPGEVRLRRHFFGTSTWSTIEVDYMSGWFPSYSFTVHPKRNADYRVLFPGNSTYDLSWKTFTIRVSRIISSRGTEPSEGVFYLSGHVTPRYAGRTIALMRKTCASCGWYTIATQKTSGYSNYSFRLPTPSSGTHYFRARIWRDTNFVTSFSDTYYIWRYL